jgi:hypothetical protein
MFEELKKAKALGQELILNTPSIEGTRGLEFIK